ncbi:hypothetical protein JVT61DRAFT_3096 [Boletus reticuloceps]|uniref:Uncharacterized protein n=1 Tax=Boletus reticuloceps TaxID=495285 RepID=A0A8I2YP55_9AGAM|nr:hypothetical protein JVT61DRAFT_3096 [Boletus reticuloceps]
MLQLSFNEPFFTRGNFPPVVENGSTPIVRKQDNNAKKRQEQIKDKGIRICQSRVSLGIINRKANPSA